MPTHFHKPSATGQQRQQHHLYHPQTTSPATLQHTDKSPTILRLPSSSSADFSPRSRRATNPSTPTLTLSQVSTSTATSPSYFSASGKDARSPAIRRPPASFSGHGIDTSRGPPITLITRGTADIGRRSSQPNPSDFAFAQQQLSPGSVAHRPGGPRRRRDEADGGEHTSQTHTPDLPRQDSARTARRQRHMASSVEESSEYDSGLRSQSEDAHAANSGRGATDTSGTDDHGEDLFLNIAEDSAAKERADAALRADRVRSRIARASYRQSFPSVLYSSPPPQSSSTTPNASRIPSTIDTKTGSQYRRASALSSVPRTQREQSPLSPATPLETPRSRLLDLSPKPSFSSPRTKDSDLSPHQFLSQIGRRRPSYPDALQTPPNRAQTYRPSNLHYSSSRDTQDKPHVGPTPESASRVEGTESLDDSTGPAASVWDELDDLKSRIRKIELGGKIPTTSGAAVANASAERPRTANTSITTVSSSPKQRRKTITSPSESTVGTHVPPRVHPLLKDALGKVKQHLPPAVYRVLEATASEAIELAELTGSAGPQGTLQSASSTLNGASVPDRQARRKADNICRSLTELCIALCDVKPGMASPSLRTVVASNSRRPSVQISGESPQIRQSIEPESDTLPRSSPSRALSRIEARRSSILPGGFNGSPRESSQDPPTPSQSHVPARPSRVGTSFQRARRTGDDEDEDPTLRAPSRAMTDFRDIRSADKAARFTRDYTSREPMPELQPSPALQHTSSLRRPTVTGASNENYLLFRDSNRRYTRDRQASGTHEKQLSADSVAGMQYSSNRNPIGGTTGLGRSGSLGRRLRRTGAGE